MGDRRHRTDVQAGSARLLLLPVVLAGAWTVVGLALGSDAAHADTASTGGSPGIALPAVAIPHASPRPDSEHEAHVAVPSASPATAVAQLPVKVVSKTLPKALPQAIAKALPQAVAKAMPKAPKVQQVTVPHTALPKATGVVAATTRTVQRTATHAVTVATSTTTATTMAVARSGTETAQHAVRRVLSSTTTGAISTVEHVASGTTDVVPAVLHRVVPPAATAVLAVPTEVSTVVAPPALHHTAPPVALGPSDTGTSALPAPAADRSEPGTSAVPATAPQAVSQPYPQPRVPAQGGVAASSRASLPSVGAPAAPTTSVLGVPQPLSGSGGPAQPPAAPVLAGTAALGVGGTRSGAPLPFALLPDGGREPALAVSSGAASGASTALPSLTYSFDVAPD